MNWWGIANKLEQYISLFIGITLSVTQIRSMYGIDASTNMMLWGYSTVLVMPITMILSQLMRFRAYDIFNRLCKTGEMYVQAYVCTALEQVEIEVQQSTINYILSGLVLYHAHEAWMKAQYVQLSEAEQNSLIETVRSIKARI